MTDATTPKPSAAADARMMQTCLMLYGVYAVGALAGFIPLRSIMLLSSIVLIAAMVVAYQWRKKAGETPYETHFHWLIRTFWIGGLIYAVLIAVASIAIYAAVDWSDVQAALRTAAMEHNPGAPDDDMKLVTDTVLKEVMQRNGMTIAAIFFGCVFPGIAWWLWRCWKGFRLLKKGQPVPNVMKWV